MDKFPPDGVDSGCMRITPAKYKSERQKRGTQEEIAALLQVQRGTIARRETKGPVSREAWLALCALPIVARRSRA